MNPFDHILLVGFGGPTRPEEVLPFLQNVSKGRNIPQERLREVGRHYERIGGRSPYQEQTFGLRDRLQAHWKRAGIPLEVFVGMRNWHPFLKETLTEIKKRGCRRGIGMVLAPHRSEASFERYLANVEEAKRSAGASEMAYEYLKPWYDHPLFIQAQVEEVRRIYDGLSSSEIGETHLIFTAHSIPLKMAGPCRYAEEIETTASLVARELGHREWSVAYQSRSGDPKDPWLAPDINALMGELPSRGQTVALLIPIGFLCDNAEILYDLDVEARQVAEQRGVRYLRASTVIRHPYFLDLVTELVEEQISLNASRRT